MPRFEVIVVGLGAMGSAALYHLARRGTRVLGVDRYAPPHAHGSSHGDTRITRLAIGEGAQYTPLALRSHELWRELEAQAGETLLTTSGALIISSPRTKAVTHVADFFARTLALARQYGIAHEVLDAPAIRRRFPQLNVAADEIGYFERDAGFVRPEACVRAHLAAATRHGAAIGLHERALSFDATASGVAVTTERASYEAETLVVAAGAWLPALVGGDLARHFAVHRQVLYWFAIEGPLAPFLPERFPVFIWEPRAATQAIYGFPALDGRAGGIKIGTEEFAHTTSADTIERRVDAREIATMYERHVAPHLRGVSSTCVRSATCLYTVTPDFGFVIDRHPDAERVVIVSPCSGHGFKHSPAIGEAVAELVRDGESRIDLRAFALRRFAASAP